ncbi:uncharacterized protein LOC114320265, partial [Camellia sinensis]|uniref:uncharacterized protein LOC114320265 n=1 Tax=Camellia sinensis TaxID=4442 RepID=UPI001035D06C
MVDDDYRKARKFESGLRGPIQDRVNMLNMPTYAGVLDKAILAEANLNRYQSSSEGQRKRQNYDNRRVPFSAKKKINVDSSSNSNQEGAAKPLCTSCGKLHFGVCRWATGACYECGEIGHRVKDCPKARTDDGKRNGSTSGSVQKNNIGGIQARQGRVFALVPGDAQNAEAVVSGTISICTQDAYVLIDSGSTHSFVSTLFAEKLDRELEPLEYVLSVSTPSGRNMIVASIYRACVVMIEGVELLVDLMPLSMTHFDVILGMD